MTVMTYKCPHCNGEVKFDPKRQNFLCEYCESEFTLAEIEATQSQRMSEGDMAFYACPSCGAEVLTEMTTAATECFYCHQSVVLGDRLAGAFKPDMVIPFGIDKEKAMDGFLKHLKKKWFVPKAFASKRQIEKMTGVYFPTWYIDCEIEADVTAKATNVRTWQDSRFRYRETSFFNVTRKGDVTITNLSKKALDKEESKLFRSVLPFDEAKAEPFTTAYLSGFQAEKRNIEIDDLQQEVNEDAKRYAKTLFQDTMNHYTAVTNTNYHVNKLETEWKYTLLPVWAMTYNDGRKVYYYAMNGQTGKVNGELPVDKVKLGFVSAGISFAVFVTLLIINRGGISL